MIEVISDRGGAVVLHAAEAQARLQTQRDLGLHVGEFLLNELIGGERPAELLAVEHVLPRACASSSPRRRARPTQCRSAPNRGR